ncbi:hypothetical protein ANCCAN_08333 [Ancylostoma caninum]|uniref:Uncharacterized protein n=1 Tax=Ancylostoma caninum TaxID=29170 RepID=A0A368GMR4_ANCCA|nr:hypothetical protein ANCCAN_08333 [Ancylostoma caninum]
MEQEYGLTLSMMLVIVQSRKMLQKSAKLSISFATPTIILYVIRKCNG